MRKPHSSSDSLLELVKQLLLGALGWSSLELKLAKTDAKALLRRFLLGISLLFAGFAILIAAVFTLAETLIGALADYVHGNLIAGLIVSAALFAITALIVTLAYAFVTRRPVPKGVVFRRLLVSRRDP